MSFVLPTLAPWQQRAHDQAADAIDAGRFGHGLLFCGAPGIGKRLVAEHLALRLLCQARRADGAACGQCRGCSLYLSRSQRDPVETRPDDSLAHPFGHSGHPDAAFIGYEFNDKARPPKMRSELLIEQIRAVSERLALTSQYGGAQVVIVDPVDAVNQAACNALLKTLEEPQPGRYLWLLSAEPERLPATIRSRCQRLLFPLPPREEALAWLQARGHAMPAAAEALAAAHGNPGLADTWLGDGAMQVRQQVHDDLAQLARGDGAIGEIAQRWSSDGQAPLRLQFAADRARGEAGGLTDLARTRRLAAWFDAVNLTRLLLRSTVRSDLAVAELLVAWRDDAATTTRSRR